MSNEKIQKDVLHEIIQKSYRELRKKEATGATDSATITEIVKVVEEEVRKNGTKKIQTN